MTDSIEARLQALEDHIAIQNLKSRYFDACDGGWNRPSHDVDKILACFTTDGVWDNEAMGRHEGHEALRTFFSGAREELPFVYHGASNPRIEVDGDTANGQWHLTFVGTDKSGNELFARAIYNDILVRAPDGWKIKSAKVTSVFFGPRAIGWKELMRQP
ncbi:MAG: nuclear transport factor 2 family protein [Sphingomonadales bacterium]|nr:MAG: nuclear transport factor 2 family protein [Sphingomonadales bacterium]